jgi:tetratricopeptide (TPR) repeat protein
LKTVNILHKALKTNPDDAKANYYIGNILYDKQPEQAIRYWQQAVEIDPELAMAWRNLGWGHYRHFNDYEKAISCYEKAVEKNDNEAVFYAELDKLYELNNNPVEDRLALFEGKNEIVKNRDDAFARQIAVLTLAGQPEKSVEYLKGKQFSYREGNSRVREMIIDAQLALGIKLFEKKNYGKALEHFLLAQIPDEEAGSARSGNRDIQVNYFIGKTYEALKNKKKAKEFYDRATSAETAEDRGFMSYYKGLSFLQLNKKAQAKEIFEKLVENANNQLDPDADQQDFFAIFGEREAENIRKSAAYTMRGLGNKGLGKTEIAKTDLEKAVELSKSNLWAKMEL